jgi:hypothetical protein
MERIRAVAIIALLCVSLAVLSSCVGSGPSTPGAPMITTTTLSPATATIGQAYSATIATSGGTLPLSYSVISGNAPIGLNLSSNNNQGTLAGTPQKQSTGPYTFTVQVRDSNNPARLATQQYTITLSNPAIPSVQCPTGNATPCVLMAGAVGVSYNATFTATGGSPFTWTATGLPAGLVLNSSTGVLSGIPAQSPTNLPFTVHVTDVVGQTSPNLQCTITIAAAAQLKITSPLTLPPGVVGTPYSFQLQATGGLPPYNWQGLSGTLPNGVNISQTGNGLISGTPNQTQTTPFTFQVQVTDSEQPPMVASSGEFSFTVTSNMVVTITNAFTAIDANAASLTVDANVTNDTIANSGVTWKLQSGTPLQNCGTIGSAGPCGNLTPSATNNLEATYTPPATQPSGANDTPTITATAVDDPSKSASFQFTINAPGAAACPVGHEAALAGTFAYLMKGFDANGTVAMAGSFHADGTGKITGGVEDINRAGTGPQVNLPIDPGSSYTLGADSRGCLMVATAAGQQTFRFSLAGFANGAPTEGKIIEFDDNTGTGTRGSGIIRAQDISSFSNDKFASSYAFGLSGFGAAGEHVALAGRLTSDGKGNIVGGNFDRNDAGNLTANSWKLSGTYSIPAGSTTGRGTVNATLNGTPFTFAAYMVNSGEVILASVDQISASKQIISGKAIASAGPFSDATLTGSHLLRAIALNRSGSNPGTRATIGVLTFDGKNAGGVTGTLFDDEAGMKRTTNILHGAATYSVDQSTGRILFTGVGTDSPVGYVARSGSGVTAFLVGTDSGAADGALEFQSNAGANFKASALAGTYSFGTDENVDYSTSNETHVARFTASTTTASGMSDQSQPRANGLLGSQPYSQAFVFNAEGIGTAGTNPAVTNGTRIFFIEESATTDPSITVGEKH